MSNLENNQGKPSGHGGQRPNSGRPKGVPNKLTADVKGMILAALDKAGGPEYLLRQSDENPVAFMSLVGKVLPMTVAGDPNEPISITITRRIVSDKSDG